MNAEPPIPANAATRARALGTSTLYEASRLPCAVDPLIRSIWRGAFIAAPAYPVACSPGDNLGLHLAVEQAPRGSVLVATTDNFVAGYWGEVLTVAAEVAGITGLVIDGGVRDVAALERRRFPVFGRGVSVRGTVKARAVVGQPILMTGVRVAPGDLVVADDDGVVILPAAECARILQAGEERAEKEAAMMRKLERGEKSLDLLGLTRFRDMVR